VIEESAIVPLLCAIEYGLHMNIERHEHTPRSFWQVIAIALTMGVGVGTLQHRATAEQAPSPPHTPGAVQPATGPAPGPDSRVQPGVPAGEIIKGEFDQSKVYPGTWREYWVYIPSQLDRSKPAPVMVFQDGLQYNAPVVFDNLIQQKAIPAMVGVFVMHGRVKALSPDALDRMNRSLEYDAVSADYARFLLDELLPHVAKTHNLLLTSDPNERAIAGNSSGAIAAFVAAWQRPDAFRRVFSAIGTYVGLRGGNTFPVLIRKTEPKPLRLFLQDGEHDNNIYAGNWWIANQDMLSALEYAGYDVRHAWGDGEHNSRHATAIFPDVLRWLWRDWPAPIKANPEGKSRQNVYEVLVPGEEWQLVSEGHRHTDGPAVSASGEMYFSDPANNRIHRAGLDGKVSIYAENTNGANGMMFGPDGRLYSGATRSKQMMVYSPDGKTEVLAEDVSVNDLAVNVKGDLYFTDSAGKKVWFLPKGGKARVVDEGIESPNGVLFSPDQTLLYVSDYIGQLAWSFQIQPDGSLAHKQRYFYLHTPDVATRSGADGMAADEAGRVYIASPLGVQVFDQMGRVQAIIPAPLTAALSNVEFGGANMDEMFITNGDKVFKRKTKVKGVVSWRPPIKPAPPRL
jgi:gluconolactonase